MTINVVNRKIQQAGGISVASSLSVEEQQRFNSVPGSELSSVEAEQETQDQGTAWRKGLLSSCERTGRYLAETYYFVNQGNMLMLKDAKTQKLLTKEQLARSIASRDDCRHTECTILGLINRNCKTVIHEAYVPGEEMFFKQGAGWTANLWREPTFESGELTKEDEAIFVAMLEEFLERLFPVDEERDYVVKWLANVIQNPTAYTSTILLLRGQQGVGKGSLVALMESLVGESNYTPLTVADIRGTKNGFLADSLLLHVEEFAYGTPKDYDTLKRLTGSPRQLIRRPYYTPAKETVYPHIIIDSNEETPLHLGEGDRRFIVPGFMEHEVDIDETSQFLDSFRALLDKGGLFLAHEFFSMVDLSDFKAGDHAPLFADKELMLQHAEDYGHNPKARLANWLDSKTPAWRNETLLSSTEIVKALDNKISTRAVTNILKERGWFQCEQKAVVDGKRVRVWATIEHPEDNDTREPLSPNLYLKHTDF